MQIQAERTRLLLYIYCSVTNTEMSPLWLSLLCNINNNLEVYLQLLVWACLIYIWTSTQQTIKASTINRSQCLPSSCDKICIYIYVYLYIKKKSPQNHAPTCWRPLLLSHELENHNVFSLSNAVLITATVQGNVWSIWNLCGWADWTAKELYE